ncbi:protein NCBP2AS2 [Nematolebias whitei]|uniref:protein NCBP2AS2 n=1 Tax=Nematolebias whitei TaxID=451745 RepID=UPI00189902D8|nr:protein NCBP2AS2 [Nematolebias whitei]
MISRLLAYLVNNLQVVEKLAESRPIRRAAQITAYAITKAQLVGRDASQRVLRSQTLRQFTGKVPENMQEVSGRLRRIRETFVKEVKEGWKDGSRQIKK